MKLPLSTDESITGLDVVVFYEVRVQDRARYIVDAMTHFGYRNGGDAMGEYSCSFTLPFLLAYF